MKNLRKKIVFSIFCSAVIGIVNMTAQENNINLAQDSKFEKLLNEKRKLYTLNVFDDTFKIQIFNGSTIEARKILTSFRREFPTIESTVIFNTPNYKVIAGNFKTRIAAEHELIEIKKLYKNAILIRPRT